MAERVPGVNADYDPPKPTPERIAAALALAEAVDEWVRSHHGAYISGSTMDRLVAYRATAPKLRTRADVDAEIVALLRHEDREPRARDVPIADVTRAILTRLLREPTTPTDSGPSSESDRSPPVAAAGAAYSPPAEPWPDGWRWYRNDTGPYLAHPHDCELTLGHLVTLLHFQGLTIHGPRPTPATKESSDTAGVEAGVANRITDHDADQREVEACSCEESEALKARITAILDCVFICRSDAYRVRDIVPTKLKEGL